MFSRNNLMRSGTFSRSGSPMVLARLHRPSWQRSWPQQCSVGVVDSRPNESSGSKLFTRFFFCFVLVTLGCDHTEPFDITDPEPLGPRETGLKE